MRLISSHFWQEQLEKSSYKGLGMEEREGGGGGCCLPQLERYIRHGRDDSLIVSVSVAF